MLNLVLVDDHKLFRDGLRSLLQTQKDLQVVGEANDARETYRLVDEANPDVVVLDVSLPDINGIAVTRELLRRNARSRVLILSMHEDNEIVNRALSAGARGYALKDQSAEDVVEAIRAVGRGETYLPPHLVRHHQPTTPPERGVLEELSHREREVFDLLVAGHNNDAIAGLLFISVKTVETHRAHILKKLGVHSMADLVRFAAIHGLLTA